MVLLYNKVVIDFELHNMKHLKSTDMEKYAGSVVEWMQSVLNTDAYVDPSAEMISDLLKNHESVFMMVENKTLKESEVGYRILSK